MAHEFRMPDIGEGLTEAEIVAWLVSVGDVITLGQPVVEVETAKTTVEITATHAGVVRSLGGRPGDTVEVGDVLFVVADEGEAATAEGGDAPAEPADGATVPGAIRGERATPSSAAHVKAMPIVRKLAEERGVDLASVTGTGPGGSITRGDVEAAAASAPGGSNRRKALSTTRRSIAAHLAESWRTIPHVTVQADVRAERLLASRAGSGTEALPVEAVVAEAVIPLLVTHPWFNATFDDGAVVLHDSIHLGFAVDTDAGLMVVVVRDAQERSPVEIGAEFRRLAAAASDRTLTPDEATGQTFTISNIGALGGGHGTPIIPMGTSAIVSIGRAEQRPVVDDGELAIGMVAPIDLSYDHRLIDGGLGQRFLGGLVAALTGAS